MVVDYSTVDIKFIKDSNTGTITYNTWGVITNFSIKKENEIYSVAFERIKPDQKKYTGKIIALNSEVLRILYYDKINQLQLEEFTRIE